MNDNFATAMRRALDETRVGNPLEATRMIQAALSDGETHRVEKDGRKPFRDVINSLAEGGRIGRAGRPEVVPFVPQGATYNRLRHECAFGMRDYRLFLPSDQSRILRGLILMLHGCTQTADDFATGTGMNLLGEQHGLAVVYPEQTPSANQMACWNWFQPAHQRRGNGEAALLADLSRSVARNIGAPENKLFAAGLSAGGAMSAILGAEYPDVFAAVGIHSGLAAGAAHDLPGAYSAMRGDRAIPRVERNLPLPVIVFHGTADTTVSDKNADTILASATSASSETVIQETRRMGAHCTLFREPGGRILAEDWRVTGMGHAWSGGAAEGSHTHPEGPDASAEMIRFFLEVARGAER